MLMFIDTYTIFWGVIEANSHRCPGKRAESKRRMQMNFLATRLFNVHGVKHR